MKSFHGEKIELQLYQHAIKDSSLALLLSRDGCRAHAKMIPRSLLITPPTTQLRRIEGEQCEFGIFYVARWKAKEVGWLAGEDRRQLRLV